MTAASAAKGRACAVRWGARGRGRRAEEEELGHISGRLQEFTYRPARIQKPENMVYL